MSVTFDNTTFTGGQSELGAFALNSFTGTGALSGAAPITINGTIDHPGSQVTFDINVANLTAAGATGTYLGYSLADADGNHIYYFTVNGGGLNTPVTIGVTTAGAVPLAGVVIPVNTADVSAPVCFVTGTRIRTVRGDIAVEDLTVGDHVVTAAGAYRPIVWLGHRDMDLTGRHDRRDAAPIRIRADAIAPGIPVRDLLVSPGHRLYLDDVLVQAGALVNGTTIVREQVDRVTYWHVELESHDILIAEGMPSESYVEAANRASFDNGEVVFGRRTTTSLAPSGPPCAPLVDAGPRLDAIRARLLDRMREQRRRNARSLGGRDIRDPSLQLIADGVALTPLAVDHCWFHYEVPQGTVQLVLASRSAVPRETQDGSRDERRLGVCVTALALDGVTVPVGDLQLEGGWHEPEDGGSFRWTDGAAEIAVAQRVSFRATPLPTYGVSARQDIEPNANPLRLVA